MTLAILSTYHSIKSLKAERISVKNTVNDIFLLVALAKKKSQLHYPYLFLIKTALKAG